ncbi:mobilome CxxCx(11)CxxC protein [Agarivorans sp. Z349TD_8]|uniref:mobilome CxxCx(11)CxxC protein n=1 Tax=Agarivorans sp. Z349TD_8 TaxID=3421434 RepID=UPI003D7D5702
MSDLDLKKSIKDYEFYCFGTTRIFEKRANQLKQLRTWITFLGLVTPVIVGGIVLSFGVNEKVMPYLILVAGIVGTFQLVLSAWSIVARWDERYEYSVESLRANTELYNSW